MKAVPFLYFFLLITVLSKAQPETGTPYKIRHSSVFKLPKGYNLLASRDLDNTGIIVIGSKKNKSFAFQKFSPDLQLVKQNVVVAKEKLPKRNDFLRFITTQHQSFLLVSDSRKSKATTGVSALQFFPDQLEFSDTATSLFQVSDKITGMTNFKLSNDSSKIVFCNALAPKIGRDFSYKQLVTVEVFDANLKKLWNASYEMPYIQEKIRLLDYTLSNDGKVYLSAKVYEKEGRTEVTKSGEVNYHYEVLLLQKEDRTPKNFVIGLDGRFATGTYLFEDANNNIVISGFYCKNYNAPIDGVYTIRLESAENSMRKINGGYYEIPAQLIKANATASEKRKMEKNESRGKDLGVYNLEIRNIYVTSTSVKIIAEEYFINETTVFNNGQRFTRPYGTYRWIYANSYGPYSGINYGNRFRTEYDVYADNIYIFSIDTKGGLEWVRKIPKSQHSYSLKGEGISMNSLAAGGNIHLFYLDEPVNSKIFKNDVVPETYNDHHGGILTGISIDHLGNVNRYDLADVSNFETNFWIRYFVRSKNNHLISAEKKGKTNLLFSIELQ